MAKKSFSRGTEEKMEHKETIANDVPDNRIQSQQQVATTDDAIKTEGAKSGFSTKKTKGKGAELKQQVISDVITGSSNTAGMGVNAAGRSVSGTVGGILGANNSTPQADKSRSSSRVGKKLDRTATKLNFTPSEQVIVDVDESKPLADGADIDQGYNGTYRNEFARSQKIAGAVPGDLLFQRSVDMIFKDKLYFIEGQMVCQNGDDPKSYFPSTRVVGYNAQTGLPEKESVEYHLGNYLHRNFHFGLRENGKVKYFYADVDDLSVNDITAEMANMITAHRLIKSNVAELDRMAMDAAAGDEKADIWTPLARAIDEPTKASALMSSIEAMTGAYIHLAYSKATTNLAFQLNRGPKDGLDETTPAIEECIGWRCANDNSIDVGNLAANQLGTNYIFNKTQYRVGDPALMIAAYDSVGKYHNKADLLLQPRGWRMHVQTADNNMNPLRLPREYANVFAGNEVFSTIDREYDPILPLCITDKANLISAINLNELCAFNDDQTETINIDIEYDTTNGYEEYSEKVEVFKGDLCKALGYTKLYAYYKMSTEEGYSDDAIPQYVEVNGVGKIAIKSHSPIGDAKAAFEIVFSFEPLDLTGYTTLIDGVDVKDVVFIKPLEHENLIEHVTYLRTVMDRVLPVKGGEFAYAYSDLRNNYIVDVKHPLINGIIEYLENSIGAKIASLIDQEDFIIPLIFSTQHMTLAQIFLCAATPWIARVRANSFKDVIYYEDNVHAYPYSKLAPLSDVPFKKYMNFDYTDYDTPLASRVMNPVQAINWTMPEFFWKVATEKYVLPWYFNENDINGADGSVREDAANMSMPSIRSGVRLGLLDNLYGMSEKDIRLSLDRMSKYLLLDEDISSFGAYKYGATTDGQILANLGSGKLFTIEKLLKCPRELGLCMDAPLGVLTRDPADTDAKGTHYKALNADGTATSYRIKIWVNKNTLIHPTILGATGVNISRAANYTQKWFELCANNATANTDIAGLVFGLGDDAAAYSPFANIQTGGSLGNGVTVRSYQRALNTRLQFLPFVISPFDGNYTGDQAYDIYDFAYMFGLCGFRASDYMESVYNREKRVVNEGLLFVNDPWIEDSPIVNGAAKDTGLTLTKGYELK